MTTLEGVGHATLRKRAPLVCAVAIAAATALLLVGRDSVVGRWSAFDPAWFTLVLVLDLLTYSLLVAQYRSGAGPRTLVLSWAYLVSSVLILLSALAIPGAWTTQGLWGGAMSGVWWLWASRHVVFPLMIGAALAPWPASFRTWVSHPEDRNLRWVSTSLVIVTLVGAGGVLAVGDHGLPAIDTTLAGGNGMQLKPPAQVLVVAAMLLAFAMAAAGLRQRRAETGIEAWAIVALVAMTGDATIVLAHYPPYSAGFYGGRALSVLSTAVVLFSMLRQVSRAHRDTADSAHRLEDENAALLEAQRLRDHMTAVVSHDMRTPLAGLQGYLEVLLDDEDLEPDLVRRMHERSWMLTRRLTLLTEDLLAAATLENGDLVVAPEPLDLRTQLAECAQVFPDLDLRLVCPPGLAVDAEPLRFQQVLGNLVRNAQKHGAEPVTITARDTASGVRITVADGGLGVPAAFVPHLFDRYSQAAGTSGGSGLGLSVARDLVAAHHGTIGYDVAANGFVVTLPRSRTDPRSVEWSQPADVADDRPAAVDRVSQAG